MSDNVSVFRPQKDKLVPSPQVTVVIPSYKASDTIERAVFSVLGQPGVQVGVIVVIDDNCATTENKVRKIADPRVHVFVNDHNRGAPFSRNRGLEAAGSPYVMFLDSDDYLTGDVLEGLVKAMLAEQADLGFAPWIRLNEATNDISRRRPEFQSAAHAFSAWLIDQKSIPPCSVLWRTDFVRFIGGWDEDLKRIQDGEIVLRGLLKDSKICLSQQSAGVYFQHASEHRITASSDHSPIITFARKLLDQDSSVVDLAARQHIIARYLYRNAKKAFRNGDVIFGRSALSLSRELGLAKNDGSVPGRLGAWLLGVENYQRLLGAIRKGRRVTPDL
ncbi:glycosyltransferase family 2 protein [Sphingobium sp. KCTC 72723]|uniref:glycosyltransferase family 2 protein n=1 Tax=Sphingobium sp. KCTC 72723 TaxID=2733867 RepID=UPI00165DD440|nr:glycosyltransferase family 2 protein [Sphingobium sp. KCTC 72723]